MRTFKVHGPNGSFTITGSYRVLAHGILAIKPDGGTPFILSPNGWLRVDVADAPTLTELLVQGE